MDRTGNVLKITKEELNEWDMPDCPPPNAVILLDEMIDHARWSIVHKIVIQFEDDGPDIAWEGSYRIGATEMQDESPWEYENEVEFFKVIRKPVTVDKWVCAP